MKKYLFFLITITFSLNGCKKATETIQEIPDNIIRTEASPTLYTRITELFPNSFDATESHPELFTDTVQKQIVLSQESEVYVTFIAEGATYLNTLGYYTYLEGDAPKSVSDIKKQIIFPNVSGEGEGGKLVQGDMVQVGNKKFPRGTVIGFFLIVNGWLGGSIDYSETTHYTDYQFDDSSNQNHIFFKEKSNNDIILGFEDVPLSNPCIDKDYNDVLLKITDNKNGYVSVNFEDAKIPAL